MPFCPSDFVTSSFGTSTSFKKTINLYTTKSDQYLVSPYNITSKSHIKVPRIKEMITNQLLKTSSCLYLGKCLGNSMGNMPTGIKVRGVKNFTSVNPLTPTSGQDRISPYNNEISNRKISLRGP